MYLVLYLHLTNNFTLDMLLSTNINPKRHVYTTHTRRYIILYTYVLYEINTIKETK